MSSIISKAKLFNAAFVTDKDTNRVLLDESKAHQWMTDIIDSVIDELSTDTDSAFKFTERVVDAIADLDPDEDTDADRLQEILMKTLEADRLTNQLTHWLAANVNHVYYLSQALEYNVDCEDGFNLLRSAQNYYLDDITRIVVNELSTIGTRFNLK